MKYNLFMHFDFVVYYYNYIIIINFGMKYFKENVCLFAVHTYIYIRLQQCAVLH